MSKVQAVLDGSEPFALKCGERDAARRAYVDLSHVTGLSSEDRLEDEAWWRFVETLEWLRRREKE